jgi:hypothetical protein
MAKPSQVPTWATAPGALIEEPVSSRKSLGWLPGDTAPAQEFNWWQNRVGEWLAYLNGLTSESLTWNATQQFDGGIEVTGETFLEGATNAQDYMFATARPFSLFLSPGDFVGSGVARNTPARLGLLVPNAGGVAQNDNANHVWRAQVGSEGRALATVRLPFGATVTGLRVFAARGSVAGNLGVRASFVGLGNTGGSLSGARTYWLGNQFVAQSAAVPANVVGSEFQLFGVDLTANLTATAADRTMPLASVRTAEIEITLPADAAVENNSPGLYGVRLDYTMGALLPST